MAANRWQRWLGLLVMAVGWWGVCAAEAGATAPDVCDVAKAKKPEVKSAIRFFHHGQTFVQAQSSTTITVRNSWPLATEGLTLGEKSHLYRRAMRCLLRGDKTSRPKMKPFWKDEWRLRSPEVTTAGKRGVTVHYKAFALITHIGKTQLGPWQINARKPHNQWKVTFHQHMLGKALKHARWKQVKVRLDGLEASDVGPEAAYMGKDTWVWDEPSSVRVDMFPPWHAAFALENRGGSTLSTLGIVLWWVCGSAALALAVLRAAPRSPSPPGPPGRFRLWSPWRAPDVSEGSKGGLTRTALWWAGLSAALGLALALLIPGARRFSLWPTLVGIAAGSILILAARPWHPGRSADQPKSPVGELSRRGRVLTRNVLVISLGLTVLGLTAVMTPGTMGLSEELAPPGPYIATLMLLQLVMVWLWLIAMAAWAWRFARDGGLFRTSWTAAWDKATTRFVAAAVAALAVVAVVMLCAYRWSIDLNWRRTNWLMEHDGSNRAHDQNLHYNLAGFGPSELFWAYTQTWVLTGIALVALLNSRANTVQSEQNTEQVSLGPSRNDMRLTAVVFALVVATRAYLFAGSSFLLAVWLLLNIAALYTVRAVGRRWSVLCQAGGDFLTEELGTAQGRRDMLEKAHQYRNVHQRLRFVDQGHTEQDTTREALEDKIRRLRYWRPPGYERDFLPDQVSVVDVALSWGPHDKWWDNALHSARIAFLFGIPCSATIVWANYFKEPKQLMLTSANPTGLLSIATWFLTWQITWAGVGLVLGALWRVLPGHRGPMRALTLTIAYAIPIGVGALVNRITDTELGNAVLGISLMLTVLTLTSLWMDMATFSGEKQLWPTRLSLLLSIYQVRTLSVQGAFLIAQLAAAAAIWNNLAGPPLKPL
ncbi:MULTISPECIES: DUF6185 family protein [unclassified Streptomyces]|uniref:DUF6185 family protein n=1 Tax=unclassified Streptomyces TaxID=2593676 RepID=UPI00168BB855|nr:MULTISPECIES: DUF6185 family protein [unclassified Streptomyces]MBD3011189.1 hypothetical protein [Streptomyces sp. 5-10]